MAFRKDWRHKTAIEKRQGAIVTGSLTDIARANNTSLAETFIGAEAVVLVDTSGSMGAADTPQGKTRYEVACEELASLQENIPGKVAVISFSSDVMFCPHGTPYNFHGGTDLTKALEFTKVADVDGIRFILISDGEPDNTTTALQLARTYRNRIDIIYVGSEFSMRGREFMSELARCSGGVAVTSDTVKGISQKTQLLLAA